MRLWGNIFRLLLFLPFSVVGQQKDTIPKFDPTAVQYITLRDFLQPERQLQTIDTMLEDFQLYDPVNRQPVQYFNLSNLGTPHYPLSISEDTLPAFDLGLHQFDLYRFTAENIRFFNTLTPYSELYYVLGLNEEQLFRASYTRNIKSNFNFAVQYQRLLSPGTYYRQNTDNHNLAVSAWYRSPNQRYDALAGFIYNHLKAAENGGVISAYPDSIIFNEDRKSVLNINLNKARSSWMDKDLSLMQSFTFGPYETEQINDTTTLKWLQPKARLLHRFHYLDRHFLYKDAEPDTFFYPAILYNNRITYDSLKYRQYSNQFKLQSSATTKRTADTTIYAAHIFEAGAEYAVHEVQQYTQEDTTDPFLRLQDTVFHNISISGQVQKNLNFTGRWRYGAEAKYFLSGYNKGDYRLAGTTGFNFSEKVGELSVKASIQQEEPVFISRSFASNHFEWRNDFGKTRTLNGELQYYLAARKAKISFSHRQIKGYLFWNAGAEPQQLEQTLYVNELKLQKNFVFRGKLHLKNMLVYQNFSKTLVHLPDFWSSHSLYYQSRWFGDALFVQTGFDIRYRSDFFAPAYMPPTGQFYLQNEREIEYYPTLDFFFNFKVKKARLFFKAEHLNTLWSDRSYYTALHYPARDFSLKGGVSWQFYD